MHRVNELLRRLAYENPNYSCLQRARDLPERTEEQTAGQRLKNSPEEVPPAYTPLSAQLTTNAKSSSLEDSPYPFLQQFDTMFLIEDSGSMAGRSWRETSQALAAITPICTEYDAYCNESFYLNHRGQRTDLNLSGCTDTCSTGILRKDPDRSEESVGLGAYGLLFDALGMDKTPLNKGAAVFQLLDSTPTTKPINVIVMTDGVPGDDIESADPSMDWKHHAGTQNMPGRSQPHSHASRVDPTGWNSCRSTIAKILRLGIMFQLPRMVYAVPTNTDDRSFKHDFDPFLLWLASILAAMIGVAIWQGMWHLLVEQGATRYYNQELQHRHRLTYHAIQFVLGTSFLLFGAEHGYQDDNPIAFFTLALNFAAGLLICVALVLARTFPVVIPAAQ